MIPSGRGALFVHDYENGFGKWILGYIEKEQWAVSSWQVVIDLNLEELRVHKIERRRDGTLVELGRLFNDQGVVSSGMFEEGELLQEFKFWNLKSCFIRAAGRISETIFEVGRHKKVFNLVGRGIKAWEDGKKIEIQGGEDALGCSIGINTWSREIQVIQSLPLTLTDGRTITFQRGTSYNFDGTTEEINTGRDYVEYDDQYLS